jgi:GDP-4-dehydro-6-deoxy-D-mannose reductase
MAPRRILVTGFSGFVGRHLLTSLRAAMVGVELLTPHFDVTDNDATQNAVREATPDACVHLAAIAAIPAAQQDPDRAWRVNLHGTLNLARAVLAHAPGCTFLFPSSAEAYGASYKCGHPLNEEALLAPVNTYGATKAAADLALGALVAEGLRAIRVRPFNHTGPGQSADYVIPAFARQVALIAAGRQPPVLRVGALNSCRDFLDVRDVCDAYVLCLSQADTLSPGLILNVASGTPRRIGDVLDGLIRAAGITVQVETDLARLRRAEIATATGDPARARQLLGWAPRISWEQTLMDVLADWRGRVSVE